LYSEIEKKRYHLRPYFALGPKSKSVVGELVRSGREEQKMSTKQEIEKFVRDESGQDLVEYALLLVFLALAAIAMLPILGQAVNNVFSQASSSLTAGS